MAKYSKSEFSEICGIKVKHLYTYMSRKEVNVKDKLIDTDDQVNSLFMGKMQRKRKNLIAAREEKKNEPVKRSPEKKSRPEDDTLVELFRQKGTLEVVEKENRIQLQRMRIHKVQGEVVPHAGRP